MTTTKPPVAHAADPPRSLKAYLQGPPRVSQRALARRLGVTQSTISMLLRGQRSPRADLALKLHKITHIPLETLLKTPRHQVKRSHR